MMNNTEIFSDSMSRARIALDIAATEAIQQRTIALEKKILAKKSGNREAEDENKFLFNHWHNRLRKILRSKAEIAE